VLLICRHPPSPPGKGQGSQAVFGLPKTDTCEHKKTLCVSKMRIEV
jgi:hypothetical protein